MIFLSFFQTWQNPAGHCLQTCTRPLPGYALMMFSDAFPEARELFVWYFRSLLKIFQVLLALELVDRTHNLNRTVNFWQCKINLSWKKDSLKDTDREPEAMYKPWGGLTLVTFARVPCGWNARGRQVRSISEVNSFGNQLHGKDIQ